MRPLALSMGDPAGIGLELAARISADRQGAPPFVFIGDAGALKRAAGRIGVGLPPLRIAQSATDIGEAQTEELVVLNTPLAMEETPGEPDPVNSATVVACIERGVAAVRDGEASALVTLPIAKEILQRTGFGFPGHTEFIADLTKDMADVGARGPVMMLAGPSLKVALATIHSPLARAIQELTQERIIAVGRVLGEALRRDFGIADPRIALCGLNPHAGESGTIGREEIEIVNPAAAALRAEGWNISDARSADALFSEEARRSYDAALALYHDQGLIPIKTLHFWDGVNITLGLPIVRTSPDHGTGFDIAGKGIARADSVRAAMATAWAMAQRRGRA